MECEPAVRVEVPRDACPFPSRAALPMSVAPSLNVTVPVGTDNPPDTDAVKVTRSPKLDGLSSELTDVVVGQTPLSATTTLNGALVSPEVAKFRISMPGAKPDVSVPTRKRTRTS